MASTGMQKLQPQAKLVWATTTPFMPDKNTGNFAVEQQNAIAAVIMTANAIPSVDLYARVIAKCGELCKGGLFIFLVIWFIGLSVFGSRVVRVRQMTTVRGRCSEAAYPI